MPKSSTAVKPGTRSTTPSARPVATESTAASGGFWLVKQEPDDYPWSALVKDGKTAWTGVRNYAARNHLRAMRVGDPVLYYHSGEAKAVVGVARVVRAAYPDPTASAEDGDWSSVDLAPVEPVKEPVALAAFKADPLLRETAFVKQSRLSVSPLSSAQFRRVLELATPA